MLNSWSAGGVVPDTQEPSLTHSWLGWPVGQLAAQPKQTLSQGCDWSGGHSLWTSFSKEVLPATLQQKCPWFIALQPCLPTHLPAHLRIVSCAIALTMCQGCAGHWSCTEASTHPLGPRGTPEVCIRVPRSGPQLFPVPASC